MKNKPVLIVTILIIVMISGACNTVKEVAEMPETYYVKADGNDRNDGLSGETPFRSLFKALHMASSTGIKTVTVMGTLDVKSEQSSDTERVFIIQGTGKDTLTIRGEDNAVLSGQGERRVLLVRGIANIRFENIVISGGRSGGEGGGIGIGPLSVVTLGPGVEVKENQSSSVGGGIAIAPGGSLYIDGASIAGNRSDGIGGGIAAVGKGSVLGMKAGEVRNNQAEGGGGIAVYQGCDFTFEGGDISGNQATVGGGVVLNQSGLFLMKGGEIRGNRSVSSGAGIAVIGSSFTMEGGEIRSNSSGEHGGAIVSDENGTVSISGGVIAANSAAGNGGAVFSGGSVIKAHGGVIYGKDAPADMANTAGEGAVAYIFLGGADKVRETTASDETILNSNFYGAQGGWTEKQ
jgi:hypothetical protein